MLALTVSIVLTLLITYIRPENYDFARSREIELVDDSTFRGAASEKAPVRNIKENAHNISSVEPEAGTGTLTTAQEQGQVDLLRARNIALGAALFIAISMTIWQSRQQIAAFLTAVIGGLSGRKAEQVEVVVPEGVLVRDKS